MGHIEAQGRLYVSSGDRGWVTWAIFRQGVDHMCVMEVGDGSHRSY